MIKTIKMNSLEKIKNFISRISIAFVMVFGLVFLIFVFIPIGFVLDKIGPKKDRGYVNDFISLSKSFVEIAINGI
jgi:hypothetical protein